MLRLRVALSAVTVVVLALVIAFAAGVSFGRAAATAPAGPEVGVMVHGDWIVTVKNGDGTVAQEHAFHNEFNGALTVAGILAHKNTTGRYWLTLSDQTGTGQNPCGDTTASSCFVFEPDDPNASVVGWFNTLSVTTTTPGAVVVTGTVIATRAGQFNHVRMLLSTCGGGTIAPNDCHPGSYGNFSARTLPAPISVIAGQQILVTVTYTFSAAP